MQMDSLPVFSSSLEDERHATRGRFRSFLIGLRLIPKTSNKCAISSQHSDLDIFYVECDVFQLRIRALAIFPHLFPTSCDSPIVIKQEQARRIQIDTGYHLDVCFANTFD